MFQPIRIPSISFNRVCVVLKFNFTLTPVFSSFLSKRMYLMKIILIATLLVFSGAAVASGNSGNAIALLFNFFVGCVVGLAAFIGAVSGWLILYSSFQKSKTGREAGNKLFLYMAHSVLVSLFANTLFIMAFQKIEFGIETALVATLSYMLMFIGLAAINWFFMKNYKNTSAYRSNYAGMVFLLVLSLHILSMVFLDGMNS